MKEFVLGKIAATELFPKTSFWLPFFMSALVTAALDLARWPPHPLHGVKVGPESETDVYKNGHEERWA